MLIMILILIVIVIAILSNNLFITYKEPFKKYFNTIKPNSVAKMLEFSVDYDPLAVDDIKDIHKYLMKKNQTG